MPRHIVFFGLLQISTLFFSGTVFENLGINWQALLDLCPGFVRIYVMNSTFSHSMLIFWLLSPFTLTMCTILCFAHIHRFSGFQSYLARREVRLKKVGKQQDFSLLIYAPAVLLVYWWATVIDTSTPRFLGLSLLGSRLLMLIHAGALSLLVPMAIVIITAELRAILGQPGSPGTRLELSRKEMASVNNSLPTLRNAPAEIESLRISTGLSNGLHKWIALAFLLVAAVAGLLAQEITRPVMTFLSLAIGIGLLGEAWHFLRTGELRASHWQWSKANRLVVLPRESSPLHFYFHVMTYLVLGGFALLVGGIMAYVMLMT